MACDWMASGRTERGARCGRTYSWVAHYSCLVSGSEEILARDRASSAKGSMMGKTYTTANGQVVTDEMIDAWCESYERGEFPDGEHTVGGIVHGRPPLSGEGTATLSVKIPLGMKEAIRRRAAAEGMTPSEFARAALSEKLLAGRLMLLTCRSIAARSWPMSRSKTFLKFSVDRSASLVILIKP